MGGDSRKHRLGSDIIGLHVFFVLVVERLNFPMQLFYPVEWNDPVLRYAASYLLGHGLWNREVGIAANDHRDGVWDLSAIPGCGFSRQCEFLPDFGMGMSVANNMTRVSGFFQERLVSSG